MYFYEFLPVVLKEINQKLSNKKSKSFDFKRLDENEGNLRHLLTNFIDNSNRKISNVKYSIPFEKADLEKGSVLFHYIPKKNIGSRSELLSELTSSSLRLPMYYKTDIGIEIPLEGSMVEGSLSAQETINKSFVVGGKSFFKKYTRTFTKDEIYIKFDNCIVMKMIKTGSKKINISFIGNLDERILGLEFIVTLIKPTLQNEPRNEVKILAFHYEYKQLIKELNLKDVFLNGRLTTKDEIAISTVYKGLVKKEPCPNITRKSLSTLITFNIANEKILLIAVAHDKGHILHKLEEIGPVKVGNDKNHEWLISVYLLLTFNDMNSVNLGFESIAENIFQVEKENPINEYTAKNYVDFMLNLIKVYDGDNSKNHLIRLAENIYKRMMSFSDENTNTFNYLQIKKRLMSTEDFQHLINQYNPVLTSLEEKIAFNILKDIEIEKELKELADQSVESYRTFIDYPIYRLYNKPKKDNNNI